MGRKSGNRDGQTRKRLRNSRPDKGVVSAMECEERAQILILLNERVASTPEIAKELALPERKVRYELDVLKKMEPPLVVLEYEVPVRGTVEKFYRATKKAYVSPDEWPGVPEPIRPGMRGSLLDIVVKDAVAAVEENTYDALPEAHMSWTPAILDAKGWDDAMAVLFRAMHEIIGVKEESAARLAASDEEGVSCTVSMLGYASANENRKVGPPVATDGNEATAKQRSRTAKPNRPSRRKPGASGKKKSPKKPQ